MFQNPFKGLRKLDYLVIGTLLLIAIGNWLLDPYKITIKGYLTDWPPFVTYAVLAAIVNLVISCIVFNMAGNNTDNWWMGKQPQSAWRRAYLETTEKKERINKLGEIAMSVWLITLIVSFVIVGVACFINLLFTERMSQFIIYGAAYFLGRRYLNVGNLKWR